MTTRERIAQAVDNEDWQRVRLSMKGISTSNKLDVLEKYWDHEMGEYTGHTTHQLPVCRKCEDVRIRIDNYIKALCRGGQLEAGMTFDHFSDGCIRNHIKK